MIWWLCGGLVAFWVLSLALFSFGYIRFAVRDRRTAEQAKEAK